MKIIYEKLAVQNKEIMDTYAPLNEKHNVPPIWVELSKVTYRDILKQLRKITNDNIK